MKWLLSPIKYIFNAVKTLVELVQLESDYMDWEEEQRKAALEKSKQ